VPVTGGKATRQHQFIALKEWRRRGRSAPRRRRTQGATATRLAEGGGDGSDASRGRRKGSGPDWAVVAEWTGELVEWLREKEKKIVRWT
jgi:hypothetical protein